MASLVTTVSHGNYPQQPKAAYLTNGVYNDAFFSYTTSLNTSYTTVGTLGPVVGATALNCPNGDYLYENGKKLYPGANPGITTYLVGVYSATSGLKGYIDPNNALFVPMVNGKPYQIQVNDVNNNYVFNADPSSNESDQGPGVYTHGNVVIDGFVASGVAPTLSVPGGSGSAATLTINSVLGNTFLLNVPNGTMDANGTLSIDCAPVQVGQEFNVIVTNNNGTALNLAFYSKFIVQPITGNGFTNGLRAIYKFIATSNTSIYQISKVTY